MPKPEIFDVGESARVRVVEVYTGESCPDCGGREILSNDIPGQGYYRCLSCNATWTIPIALRDACTKMFPQVQSDG